MNSARPSQENPFHTGLWPFYGADARDWAGARESRALASLLHWEESDATRFFEARPFYSSLKSDEELRWDFLYPIAADRRHADRRIRHFFLIANSKDYPETGAWQKTLVILFGGRTEGGEAYGGVFPAWGVFKKRLGWDRVRFRLWPLFARAERGGYTETQVLWPFFAWGKGEGRWMFRFWPLFGIRQHEGIYDRRFYLWPFIHHRRDHLDTESPSSTFYFLPFYGRKEHGTHAQRFYLFPLYLRQWDRAHPGVGRIDLVWPIYYKAKTKGGDEFFGLRPLYTRARREKEQSFSYGLGLYGRTDIAYENHEERTHRVFWAGRIGSRTKEEQFARRRDIWPFYRSLHVRESDGSERGWLRVPYLIPMRGLDPDGWDRHYNKLFELYGARWRNDEYRSSLLFGLRELRKSSDATWVNWGGFLHLRR